MQWSTLLAKESLIGGGPRRGRRRFSTVGWNPRARWQAHFARVRHLHESSSAARLLASTARTQVKLGAKSPLRGPPSWPASAERATTGQAWSPEWREPR